MTNKKCAETTYTRCEEVGCHYYHHHLQPHYYPHHLFIVILKLFKSGVLRFLTPFVRWLKFLYPLRSLLDYIDAAADENYGVMIKLLVLGK